MRAGQKVIMVFPDGSSGPVPVEAVAQAVKAGATVSRPKYSELPTGKDYNLPGALGMLSMFIPGAGLAASAARIGTAAALGGTGRAITNATEGRPIGEGVGNEMLNQGGSQTVGEVAAPVVNAFGTGLVGSSIAGKGMDVIKSAKQMVANRIPVGGFGGLPVAAQMAARDIPLIGPSLVRGSDVAGADFGSALAARNAANSAATQAGKTIPRKAVESGLMDAVNNASKDMADPSEVNFLKKRLAYWRAKKLEQIPVDDVQGILTRYDAKLKPYYAALNGGNFVPTESQSAAAAYRKAVVDALRPAIRDAVPAHEALSSTLGNTIAAKNAVNKSQALAGPGLMAARSVSGGVLGSAVGGLVDPNHAQGAGLGAVGGMLGANSPQAVSRLGLLLSDPAILAALRLGPRFAAPDVTQQGGQ